MGLCRFYNNYVRGSVSVDHLLHKSIIILLYRSLANCCNRVVGQSLQFPACCFPLVMRSTNLNERKERRPVCGTEVLSCVVGHDVPSGRQLQLIRPGQITSPLGVGGTKGDRKVIVVCLVVC